MVSDVISDDIRATTPGAWKRQQEELNAEAHRLYDTYLKPLERSRWGEFVAVALDGRLVLNQSLDALAEDATAALGPGHVAFKIGEIAVEKVR